MWVPDAAGPLVFAHRGSSIDFPEHTLPAYLRAIEEGVDGVECDIRLTSDGHLVCLHDRRLERTSNGRGLVSRRTLADLDGLDFGRAHRPVTASGAAVERARVLTLDRLLAAVRDAGRPLRLLIETKHPSRYGSAVEVRLVHLLRRYGLLRPDPDGISVTVMSFSTVAVRRIRQLAPLLPTVLLLEFLPPWLRDGRLPAGVPVAGPGLRLLRTHPWFAERVRRHGHGLYVWTVNEPADLKLVLDLAVDGVISDRPGYVLEQLGRAA